MAEMKEIDKTTSHHFFLLWQNLCYLSSAQYAGFYNSEIGKTIVNVDP